jgi:hypothetical protein
MESNDNNNNEKRSLELASDDRMVLNWYFQFKNASMFKLFVAFNRGTKLSYFFMFVLIFFVFVLFPSACLSLIAMITNLTSVSPLDQLFNSIKFLLVSLLMTVSVGIGHQQSPVIHAILSPVLSTVLPAHCTLFPPARVSSFLRFYSPFSSRSTTVLPTASIATANSSNHIGQQVYTETTESDKHKRDPLLLLNPMLVILVQLYYAVIVLQYIVYVHYAGNPKATLFQTHHRYLVPTPVSAAAYPNNFVVMHSFLLFFIPCFFFASMPDLSISVVWNVLIASAGFLVWTAVYLSAHDCFAILAMLLISSSLLIVDLQMHKVRMFLTAVQLRDSLTENERNAAAKHVEELRHMIGNVAHDLKTVSSCYYYCEENDDNNIAWLMIDCCLVSAAVDVLHDWSGSDRTEFARV